MGDQAVYTILRSKVDQGLSKGGAYRYIHDAGSHMRGGDDVVGSVPPVMMPIEAGGEDERSE